MDLAEAGVIFERLYGGVDGYAVAKREKIRLGYEPREPPGYGPIGRHGYSDAKLPEPGQTAPPRRKMFLYGEVKFLPFAYVLSRANVGGGGVFYDLGSGSGKAVFTAALSRDFTRLCGVEYLPGLYRQSMRVLKRYDRLFRPNLPEDKQRQVIEFVNGDFLEHDFSDADVIYVASTSYGEEVMERLALKLNALKEGSKVISLTMLPPSSYRLVEVVKASTSWSSATPFHIHEKRG